MPALAQLDLAELEVAQLGDRFLAQLGDQADQLDLVLGDLAPALGDVASTWPEVPRSRASSRSRASTRVTCVSPCA